MTEMASLVLYATEPERTVAFYRACGIDLEREEHDDGPVHFAAELGPIHVAVYAADEAGSAPGRRAGGSSFPSFYVDSLDEVTEALRSAGALHVGEHEQLPWGCRAVFADPDGRAIEINQRDRCAG